MLPAWRAEPPRRKRLAWIVVAAGWIFVAPAAMAARVVALGDVHGDVAALERVLRAAGVLDAANEWTAGETWVVQVGDLLDRGPQHRGALELSMALERKAAAAGGRFVQMAGNHEVMNLVGDLRYVTTGNFAEFADERSEERRRRAWREYRDWQRRRADRLGLDQPKLGTAARDEWLATHPPGFLEHRQMFASEGRYGSWLRQRPSTLRLGDVLFVHGGLSPAFAGRSLEAIGDGVREEIERFDALRAQLVERDLVLPSFDLVEMTLALRDELAALERNAAESAQRGASDGVPAADAERRELVESFLAWDSWSIYDADGPLWFRGYSHWSDDEITAEMPALLAAFDARHIVVGHTPQSGGRIRVRADGAVFLIDAGMNASYVPGGRAAALEIVDGSFSAIYPDEPTELLWQDEASSATAAEPAAAPAPESSPAGLATDRPAAAGGRSWLGPDDRPLPFANDDELVEFLASAEVVADEPIGQGITRPHRLTLVRDGVTARATFRSVEEKRRIANLGRGRREMNFRDYYGFEPAAYRLGRLLGVANIPPATLRRVKGAGGSVQIWVEGAMTEGRRLEADVQPPNTVRWLRQLQMMRLWDELVGNTDRNQGNILFDADWQLWMIDHTRAFRHGTELENAQKTTWCERGFYDKLRSIGDEEIREAMQGLLAPSEIRSLLQRRTKLVAVLEEIVAERGEDAVLFRWTD